MTTLVNFVSSPLITVLLILWQTKKVISISEKISDSIRELTIRIVKL